MKSQQPQTIDQKSIYSKDLLNKTINYMIILTMCILFTYLNNDKLKNVWQFVEFEYWSSKFRNSTIDRFSSTENFFFIEVEKQNGHQHLGWIKILIYFQTTSFSLCKNWKCSEFLF